MWIKIFKKLFQKKNNLPTYPPMINIMGRVTATKVSFMGSLRVRLVPLIFLYFLYLGSMCKTPPKFYIGLNRQKSQNFPKSLWMLKYWILRYKTWIQSSLWSKMRWGGGGRSKIWLSYFDVFDHKIHNIWVRIKNCWTKKNQYLSLQRDFGKFRDFSLLNPI